MRSTKMRDIFCKEMQPLVDKLKTQRGQLQIIVDKAKVGQFDPYNSTTNQYSNQGIVQFIDGFKIGQAGKNLEHVAPGAENRWMQP